MLVKHHSFYWLSLILCLAFSNASAEIAESYKCKLKSGATRGRNSKNWRGLSGCSTQCRVPRLPVNYTVPEIRRRYF